MIQRGFVLAYIAILINYLIMTLQKFEGLTQDHQDKYLLLNGVCIASRQTGENSIYLFQLYNFYVEVHFHDTSGEFIHSRSFEDTEELYPYLEQINITCLN
jgi:hypothetical protein